LNAGIQGKFLKLHCRRRRIEQRSTADTDQEAQDRHRQGQRLGASGVIITHKQHRDATENREPDDKTQQRQFRQHGFSSSRLAGDKPGQQDQQTDDHRKRIGIQIAGLQMPGHSGDQPTSRAVPLTSTPSIKPASPYFHSTVPKLRLPRMKTADRISSNSSTCGP
jgi:hypothetical protein